MAIVHALREPDQAPSVTQSLDRLVDAAQGLAADQVALIRLEVEATLVRLSMGALVVGLGLLMLISGWVAGLCALVLVLARWMPPAASLGILAVTTLAIGAAVAYVGARRLLGGS